MGRCRRERCEEASGSIVIHGDSFFSHQLHVDMGFAGRMLLDGVMA